MSGDSVPRPTDAGIVIFGGWDPWRVAAGYYLFGLLKALGNILQRKPAFAAVPTQIFSSAPFALMIFALLISEH